MQNREHRPPLRASQKEAVAQGGLSETQVEDTGSPQLWEMQPDLCHQMRIRLAMGEGQIDWWFYEAKLRQTDRSSERSEDGHIPKQ